MNKFLQLQPEWARGFLGGDFANDEQTGKSNYFILMSPASQAVQTANLSGTATATLSLGSPEGVIIPISQPNGAIDKTLRAKRLVGAYGVVVEVSNANLSKLKNWDFPTQNADFGWLTLSRNGERVALSEPLRFKKQIFINQSVCQLVTQAGQNQSKYEGLNKTENYCLNRIDVKLAPGVQVSVGFLPVYECIVAKWEGKAAKNCGMKATELNATRPEQCTPPWIEGSTGYYWGCNDERSLTEEPHQITYLCPPPTEG